MLDHLDKFPGLQEAFEIMNQNGVYTVFSHDGDTIMGPIEMPTGGGVSNAGMNVHRSSLNRCLYEYVQALGIEVLLNTRVASYYDNGRKGCCVTKTGENFEADIVIAADGIGSHSSNVVSSEGLDGIAKSSGYAVFRCTYPAGELSPIR